MDEIWCNGRWLDAAQSPMVVMDRTAMLGLGLFETMLAVDGGVAFAERHLERIRRGGERFGWEIELPGFHAIATEVLVRNGLAVGKARLRLTATSGSGPLGELARGEDAALWLAAFPASPAGGEVAVGISPWPRNERSPLAGLKCASYAENLVALDHARRRGFQETIFLNTAGELCEAATANLFLVQNGRLRTPPVASGCLPGIAREVVMEMAGINGLACGEVPLHADDLRGADEIFLTSAVRGVVAVTRVDDQQFPAGPVTAKARDLWQRAVASGI